MRSLFLLRTQPWHALAVLRVHIYTNLSLRQQCQYFLELASPYTGNLDLGLYPLFLKPVLINFLAS